MKDGLLALLVLMKHLHVDHAAKPILPKRLLQLLMVELKEILDKSRNPNPTDTSNSKGMLFNAFK